MLSIYNFLKIRLCYRTYWKQWLALLAICLLIFACSGGDGDSDNPNNPCPNQPQLTTLEVSNINIDENTDLASATFTGEIQNIQLGANCETFSITNQGFVYSTNIQPTTIDNVVNANGENASANVSNLMAETTYYVRAYLTNTLGTFYGNEVSFTTPQSTNPVYLAENGVTIKARDWALVGDSGIINGIAYTIVDGATLIGMITNGDDVTRVCTSRIVEMNEYFSNVPNFNQDISSWDVSNVTNMERMFEANSFNQDIGYWDVSNVTNMKAMFNFALYFNQDLNNWDVSNVTNMNKMFWYATSFNGNISSWDVSNVNDMALMFTETSFNQDISNWNVSNVTDMTQMFMNTPFNQDLSSWDVANVTFIDGMFSYTEFFNQDLSDWDTSSVAYCGNFCLNANSWTLPKPNFSNCGDIGCD
mgnify:CR=1 FL=1